MAALIAAQREAHRIPCAVSCRALGVSRSWFYKWQGGTLPPRAARRERLKAEVKRLFTLHKGKYGSPRITADLKDAGWRVSQNTVAGLMREQHLAARRTKRRSTTRPGRARWRAPDLVRREFPAQKINQKWYGDGTEIPTGQGKLQLASVLDMGSRRLLGFALSEHHDVGNAVIEAWHSTIEFELRRVEHFATKAAARAKVAAWIDDYNRNRRHSALNMMSPIDCEHALEAGKA